MYCNVFQGLENNFCTRNNRRLGYDKFKVSTAQTPCTKGIDTKSIQYLVRNKQEKFVNYILNSFSIFYYSKNGYKLLKTINFNLLLSVLKLCKKNT